MLSSCWITLAGLAPVRSILLMNASRGTWYRFIWRSTVIDCDCTPATAQSTSTAPSRTRSDRSTSTVKSTWPGRVDDVDLLVAPLDRGRGRGDRDPPLLLQLHVVHHRAFALDLLDHVDPAGVVQDPLGERGLARVDVGRDPDVADVAKVFHCTVTSSQRVERPLVWGTTSLLLDRGRLAPPFQRGPRGLPDFQRWGAHQTVEVVWSLIFFGVRHGKSPSGSHVRKHNILPSPPPASSPARRGTY